MKLRLGFLVGTLVFIPAAYAQLDVGSDGSDGVLVFNGTADSDGNPNMMTIDLSKAVVGSWDTTHGGDIDGDGVADGVYDPQKWAVVFKYSSVTIPASKSVGFINHPSGAPVVWLVQTDVVINSNTTVYINAPPTPLASEPSPAGPGGFRGARATFASDNLGSGGYGPGGGRTPTGLVGLTEVTAHREPYGLPGARARSMVTTTLSP